MLRPTSVMDFLSKLGRDLTLKGFALIVMSGLVVQISADKYVMTSI